MSHELRTPLNAIIGFSEIVLRETFGPIANTRYRDYVDDIRGSGSHLLELINDILDLSKAEAGQIELQLKVTREPAQDVVGERLGDRLRGGGAVGGGVAGLERGALREVAVHPRRRDVAGHLPRPREKRIEEPQRRASRYRTT